MFHVSLVCSATLHFRIGKCKRAAIIGNASGRVRGNDASLHGDWRMKSLGASGPVLSDQPESRMLLHCFFWQPLLRLEICDIEDHPRCEATTAHSLLHLFVDGGR